MSVDEKHSLDKHLTHNNSPTPSPEPNENIDVLDDIDDIDYKDPLSPKASSIKSQDEKKDPLDVFLYRAIPLDRNKKIKTLSLIFLRLSIMAMFSGYFLILQPYNNSIPEYISKSNDAIKLIASFILIGLILSSFFYLLKCYEDHKRSEATYEKPSRNEKLEKIFNFLGIIITLFAQIFLFFRLFISFIVQWLTPALFALSCLSFTIQALASKKNCLPKLCTSLLFFTSAFDGFIVLMDTLNTVPSFIDHSMWTNQIVPIVLIGSVISSFLTILEPALKIYYGEQVSICKEKINNLSLLENQQPKTHHTYFSSDNIDSEVDNTYVNFNYNYK